MSPSTPIALVLAAGRATRYGDDTPKQFLSLLGRPVVRWAIDQHLALGHHVVVVVAPEQRDRMKALIGEAAERVDTVAGGATRRESVLAGVDAIPWTTHPDTAVVLRNAASPNTPDDLVLACVRGLASHDGMQAFVPSNETTFIHARGSLDKMIAREATGFTADPTVYRRSLIDAVADEMRAGRRGETTLDIARRLGADIGLAESPPSNIKLTQAGDLERLAALMAPAGAARSV